jgi:hypothetical protein
VAAAVNECCVCSQTEQSLHQCAVGSLDPQPSVQSFGCSPL